MEPLFDCHDNTQQWVCEPRINLWEHLCATVISDSHVCKMFHPTLYNGCHHLSMTEPGVLCNRGYPSETHLKLKSREISFVHNIRPIGLKLCTEHGSDTAVLCAKFQTNRSTGRWVMSNRDVARFESKMNFGWISYVALGPSIRNQ